MSMGANAARHAREIVENVLTIVAIELLTATQAIDLRRDGPSRLGRATRVAYGKIRERVSKLERDRQLSPDIGTLVELIYSRELLEAVEAVEAATA